MVLHPDLNEEPIQGGRLIMSSNTTDVTSVTFWELPLGTIRGRLEEPGPRFVDPHAQEEREAIQEEGQPSKKE